MGHLLTPQSESQPQAQDQTPSGHGAAASQDISSQMNTTVLHPVLQQALGSLDVDLEEELARYRRQAPGRMQRSRRAATAYVAALTQNHQSESAKSLAIAQSSTAQGSLHDHMTNVTAAHGDSFSTAGEEESAPDRYLESSEELLRSLEDLQLPQDGLQSAEVESEPAPGGLKSLLTPLGLGSMLLLILSSATLGYLLVNPSVISQLAFSSEGDRTSLGSDTAMGRPDGISPDLTSNEFDPLDLNRLSSIPSEQASDALGATDAASETEAESNAAAENGDLPAVAVPDTAANDAARRSPAMPSSASQPSRVTPAPAQPSAPSRSTASRSAQPQSAPNRSASQSAALPQVEAAPVPSSPSSNSSRSNPAAASEPSSSASRSNASVSANATAVSTTASDDYVYVVAPYTGDNSLEQAQQAVSGAYVRNFPGGAQVQMGAFSDPEGAQNLVRELNNQGIQAEILD